jgi:hypothetical protein
MFKPKHPRPAPTLPLFGVWVMLCGACALTIGCSGSNVITPFPPGVDPRPLTSLADALPPAGEVLTSHGTRPEGGVWVEGRALIPEPIDDVVATFLSDPALMVDPAGIETFDATWDVEPDYPHSVRIHQVTGGFVSVAFDVTWRMAPQLEPDGTMTAFSAVYQKTSGTSLIKVMEGSISARKLNPFSTMIEFYTLVDAPTIDGEDVADSIRRMYEGLRDRVASRPTP